MGHGLLTKIRGSLGLRRIKEANEACMLKLGWYAASADSLWPSDFVPVISKALQFGMCEIRRVDHVFGKELGSCLPTSSETTNGSLGMGAQSACGLTDGLVMIP